MKTTSQSRSQHGRNGKDKGGGKRYTVGSVETPVGNASQVVWLTEISSIDRPKPGIVAIRCYQFDTIWAKEDDAGVKELIRDWERMIEQDRNTRANYAEHLREQRHGAR